MTHWKYEKHSYMHKLIELTVPNFNIGRKINKLCHVKAVHSHTKCRVHLSRNYKTFDASTAVLLTNCDKSCFCKLLLPACWASDILVTLFISQIENYVEAIQFNLCWKEYPSYVRWPLWHFSLSFAAFAFLRHKEVCLM